MALANMQYNSLECNSIVYKTCNDFQNTIYNDMNTIIKHYIDNKPLTWNIYRALDSDCPYIKHLTINPLSQLIITTIKEYYETPVL